MSKIYFITDVHADRDAFLHSFDRCGDKEGLFLIGGNTFDEGPSSLEVIREYKSLIDSGVNMEFLIGNRDLQQLIVLKHWKDQTQAAFASIFSKKRFQRHIWPFINECGGINAAKKAFLDKNGEFFWFFERQKLLKIAQKYMFLHAGVDDFLCDQAAHNGEKSINFIFKSILKSNLDRAYFGEYSPAFKTNHDIKNLTERGTNYLKGTGVEYVIHGHEKVFGEHQMKTKNNIKHILCNCVIDKNSRKKNNMKGNGWAFLEINLIKNKIIGRSSEGTTYFN